jgi:hypothetical protein
MSLLKQSDGLKFLTVPYAKALNSDFLPTVLTNEDYPNMIPVGQSVETIADTAVLIAYNWPKNTDRYRRVEMFVNALFPKVDEFFQPPHHVKWREVNLASQLPGWNRLESAEAWLNTNAANPATGQQAQSDLPLAPRRIRDTQPHGGPEQESLWKEFMNWREQRARRQ